MVSISAECRQLDPDGILALRARLAQTLERHPLDFIGAIDLPAGVRVFAGELCCPLPSEHDIRFSYRDRKHGEIAVFARRLPWDSDFFGFETACVDGIFILDSPGYYVEEDLSNAAQLLVGDLKRRDIRHATAKVDSRDVAVCWALGAAGFDLIETRLWYHRSLIDFQPEERFKVRCATADDVSLLARTAVNRKNLYDRFHADPVISDELVDRLMAAWVKNSIVGDFADFVLVPDFDEPAAFSTVRFLRHHWEPLGLKVSQTVLSAVGHSFRGWYQKIFSEVCCHLRESGSEHIISKTQSTNPSVIRTWENLGLRFGKAELVFRYTDMK